MKSYNWQKLFAQHKIFSEFETSEVAYFLDDTTSADFIMPKDGVILNQDDGSDSIFFIASGAVEVLRRESNGKKVRIAVLKEGDYFGEMAMMHKKPRSASVISREDSLILEIKGEAFRGILKKHPNIEVQMLLKLSDRLEEMP